MFPRESSAMKVQLKAGAWYWDTTDYPVGGDLRRAPATGGVVITNVKLLAWPQRRCTHCGDLQGRRVVFDMDHAIPCG